MHPKKKVSGKLLQGNPILRTIFAHVCRLLAIFTLVSIFSFCNVGAFLAVFRHFQDLLGFPGAPPDFCGPFWGNLGHFWPFLD